MLNQRLLGNSTNKTMLFDVGDLCASFSGGWSQSMTTSDTQSDGTAYQLLQLALQAGCIASNSVNAYSHHYRCTAKVNLEPYQKLCMLYSYKHISNQGVIFGAGKSAAVTRGSGLAGSGVKTILQSSAVLQTAALDLSEVTYSGYVYVDLCNWGSGNYAAASCGVQVYKVWLEW